MGRVGQAPSCSGPAVNDQPVNWRARTCTGLASAIVIGFFAFFSFSVTQGISKQSVYTGAVGFWLGVYLLFAAIASTTCVALLLWMSAKHEARWRRQAGLLLCAWLVTLLGYWAWHLFAQTQYASVAGTRPQGYVLNAHAEGITISLPPGIGVRSCPLTPSHTRPSAQRQSIGWCATPTAAAFWPLWSS